MEIYFLKLKNMLPKALWSFLFPVGTWPFTVKDICHFCSSPAITPHFNNSFFRNSPFIGHMWTKPDSPPFLPWSDTLEERDTQDQTSREFSGDAEPVDSVSS